MEHYDLIIIGGGPIGLSCGIAAQKSHISYKIIEKGSLTNSLVNFPEDMSFYSSSDNLEIGNIPFTSLNTRSTKLEALEYYRRVTSYFNLNIGLYEAFEKIEKLESSCTKPLFQISTSKQKYTCNFVVNSTGFYDTPKLMNIPGEELEKVKHYFKTSNAHYKQKMAIIGGSNSAIDVAIESFQKGAEVTVLVRADKLNDEVKYWIRPFFENRVKEGKISIYYNAEILKIEQKSIIFKNNDQTTTLANDIVYAMTGYQPNFAISTQLGIQLDKNSGIPVYNTETMESNHNGVYLAGVVCGGFNTHKWFIDNSRDHGDKIINHIIGKYGN